jgi:hypothetical protein
MRKNKILETHLSPFHFSTRVLYSYFYKANDLRFTLYKWDEFIVYLSYRKLRQSINGLSQKYSTNHLPNTDMHKEGSVAACVDVM